MTWDEVLAIKPLWLNIGGNNDHHPRRRWRGYIAVDNQASGEWAVRHDLSLALPIPDHTCDRILSEHFLEHLQWANIRLVIRECHRVLKPGGHMRIAVPDCYHPKMVESLKAGRDLLNHRHQVIITADSLCTLLNEGPFKTRVFYHYWTPQGDFVRKPINYGLGWVKRTPDNDRRNKINDPTYGDLAVTSIVADLFKE